MPSREKLADFAAWCHSHITGDEKGQAQIFLDRLFQAFGQPGALDVGGQTEFRIRKCSWPLPRTSACCRNISLRHAADSTRCLHSIRTLRRE
jgi:hypothetical protein